MCIATSAAQVCTEHEQHKWATCVLSLNTRMHNRRTVRMHTHTCTHMSNKAHKHISHPQACPFELALTHTQNTHTYTNTCTLAHRHIDTLNKFSYSFTLALTHRHKHKQIDTQTHTLCPYLDTHTDTRIPRGAAVPPPTAAVDRADQIWAHRGGIGLCC